MLARNPPSESAFMSDKFVTVATFNRSFEAQLAKNLLEDEGITSNVSGELTADMLPFGQAGGGDQIVLQVPEEDAQRAAGVLAVVAAAKLDDNWEDEAESGAGVWLCSICGEPISNRLSVCYSCQTPREGIRAATPRDSTAIQSNPPMALGGDEFQKPDDLARTPPLPAIAPALEAEDEADEPPLSCADDLARHAFGAAFFGLLIVLLLPLSWYYLLQLMSVPDALSPKGRRYLYGAIFINGIFLLPVLVLCLVWLR
jgi:hypothetical protein